MKQVEHFTGIEDMPIHRWQDFNVALLVEAGAGNGIEGLESMLATAYRHLAAKEHEKAGTLILNSLENIAFAKERVLPLTVAWAATVHKIEGQDVSHLSAEKIAPMLDFSNQKVFSLKQFVEDFGKKCRGELEVFFPSLAKSPIETESANYLKKRTQLLLQSIIQDRDVAEDLKAVEKNLLSLHRPQRLAGANGVEVQMKRDFDERCLILQTHGIQSPESLSVRKFYAAIEMLSKKK